MFRSDPRGAIHAVTIVAMGVHLLDNCALDAFAEACAQRSRWTFLLAVAPFVPNGLAWRGREPKGRWRNRQTFRMLSVFARLAL